ncbi:hypothetical protein GA0111570_1142 [Raineyella antarctica]|uniref:DUF1684 domain-containing protein n=2 Tax=Raineyella antarctica TaxID=1577474 RepID=A0A1G6I307_9ACTN|nr:hypothetical protein GA0111570_1142 [Raineyella antarctica]
MTQAYDIDSWHTFRARREAELVEPHGWLTLQGFHWLPTKPGPLPGLPGTWSATQAEARLDATAIDGLTIDGVTLDGASTLTVAEAGRLPWVDFGEVQVELLRRGGRLAIRLRAESSAAREAFDGVEHFDFDPDWVIEGTYEPYDELRPTEVATIRPDLRQSVKASGEVRFTLDGRPQRLTVTSMKYGLGVEFHDPTNGDETPAWRQLKFAEPDPDGTVVLDFNRTVDMWFAFTAYATCPAPIEGNHVTVPVRAGEKTPR